MILKEVLHLKKFILFLITAIFLCSCSETETTPEDVLPEIPLESSITSSEEEKVFPLPDFEDIKICVESVLENEIESALKNPEVLEHSGINFRAENISVSENQRFSCDFVLEKDGTEKIFPVKGIWLFAKDNFEKQNYTGFESFINVSLGGASFAGENRIAICFFEKAVVFDPDDFSGFIEIELPEDFWPVGISCDESGYYAPAYNLSGYSKTFIFDKNGKLWSEQNLAKVDMGAWLGFALPEFNIKYELLGKGEGKYLVSGNIAYGIFSGNFYRVNFGKTLTYNDYDIIFLEYYYTDTWGNENVYCGKCATLFHKEKGFAEIIYLSNNDFDIESDELSLFYDGKLFFRTDDGYGNKENLNFGKLIYNDSQLYSKFVLEEKIAAFGDKKYSLWKTENYSAGDGESYLVVLKDEQSGKTFELCENGGSVSGNHSEGFLENGDAFVMNESFLKIYSAGTDEVLFYSDEIFGKISETKFRGLLAFLRNPEDFSFAVLYYEHSAVNYEDSVYTVAFLSPEGKILETYESGIKVPSYYGIQNTVMFRSEDNLIFTALEGKGNDEFSFVFDMETKTFSRME